jgi:hypothetical protein
VLVQMCVCVYVCLLVHMCALVCVFVCDERVRYMDLSLHISPRCLWFPGRVPGMQTR